jgi:hypothetical protein
MILFSYLLLSLSVGVMAYYGNLELELLTAKQCLLPMLAGVVMVVVGMTLLAGQFVATGFLVWAWSVGAMEAARDARER